MIAAKNQLFAWNWLPARYADRSYLSRFLFADELTKSLTSRAERVLSKELINSHQLDKKWGLELPKEKWVFAETARLHALAFEIGLASYGKQISMLVDRAQIKSWHQLFGAAMYTRAIQYADTYPNFSQMDNSDRNWSESLFKTAGIRLMAALLSSENGNRERFLLRFPAQVHSEVPFNDLQKEELDKFLTTHETSIDPAFQWALPVYQRSNLLNVSSL